SGDAPADPRGPSLLSALRLRGSRGDRPLAMATGAPALAAGGRSEVPQRAGAGRSSARDSREVASGGAALGLHGSPLGRAAGTAVGRGAGVALSASRGQPESQRADQEPESARGPSAAGSAGGARGAAERRGAGL